MAIAYNPPPQWEGVWSNGVSRVVRIFKGVLEQEEEERCHCNEEGDLQRRSVGPHILACTTWATAVLDSLPCLVPLPHGANAAIPYFLGGDGQGLPALLSGGMDGKGGTEGMRPCANDRVISLGDTAQPV